MTEFKVGDRVKVEYEGEVQKPWMHMPGGLVAIKPVGKGYQGEVRSELESKCTLIEPEIVLDEIDGTIVQIDPKSEHRHRNTFTYGSGMWQDTLGLVSTASLIESCRKWGYVQYPAVTK